MFSLASNCCCNGHTPLIITRFLRHCDGKALHSEQERGARLSLELGLSTVFWVDEGITPDKLNRLANSTVRHVEVVWHCQHIHLTQTIVEQTARVLSDNGIVCHSLHAPFGETCNSAAIEAGYVASTREAYRRCLDYLQTLGGAMLVAHPSFGVIKEDERTERLKHSIESLAWLAEECRKVGVVLAVENLHHQQLGNTASELDQIIRTVGADSAGICLDFAHAFLAEGAAQTLANLNSQIVTLHVCDNTHPEQEITCWPLAPRGLIDWTATFRELKNKSYDGLMMYEVYESRAPYRNRDGIGQVEDNYRELMRVFEDS